MVILKKKKKRKRKDELTFSVSPFLKLSSSFAVALKSYFPRASIRTDSAVFTTCSSNPEKAADDGRESAKNVFYARKERKTKQNVGFSKRLQVCRK